MIYGKVSINGLVLTMVFDLRLRLVSLATDLACWREPGPVSVDPSPSIDLLVVLVLVTCTVIRHVLGLIFIRLRMRGVLAGSSIDQTEKSVKSD